MCHLGMEGYASVLKDPLVLPLPAAFPASSRTVWLLCPLRLGVDLVPISISGAPLPSRLLTTGTL